MPAAQQRKSFPTSPAAKGRMKFLTKRSGGIAILFFLSIIVIVVTMNTLTGHSAMSLSRERNRQGRRKLAGGSGEPNRGSDGVLDLDEDDLDDPAAAIAALHGETSPLGLARKPYASQWALPNSLSFTGLAFGNHEVDAMIPPGVRFQRRALPAPEGAEDKNHKKRIEYAVDTFDTEKQLCDRFCDDLDIVYTWVNGSDIPFKLRKYIALDNKGGAQPWRKPTEQLYPLRHAIKMIRSNNQDKDNDELKYSIRGLKKFLPWHRGRIFLVSPGHTPSWLDQRRNFFATSEQYARAVHDIEQSLREHEKEHHRDEKPQEKKRRHEQAKFLSDQIQETKESFRQRLTVIFQDVMVREEFRFKFSSNAVEPHLYAIPGLSDMLVHVNDDYMFVAPTNISHFLNKYGGGNLFFSRGIVKGGWEQYEQTKKEGKKTWYCGVVHSNAVASDVVDRHVGQHGRLYQKMGGYAQAKQPNKKLIDQYRKILGFQILGGAANNGYMSPEEQEKLREQQVLVSPGNVTGRFFLEHSPFVYSRKVLRYMDQIGVSREYFDNAKPRGRHCEDVYTPFLHHAIALDAPWRGCDMFYEEDRKFPMLPNTSTSSSLVVEKTFQLGPSTRDTRDGNHNLEVTKQQCPSPFTFKTGDASISAFLFLKDNQTDGLTALSERLEQSQGRIKFVTINDGYKNQSTADILHQWFEKRYPKASIYEAGPDGTQSSAMAELGIGSKTLSPSDERNRLAQQHRLEMMPPGQKAQMRREIEEMDRMRERKRKMRQDAGRDMTEADRIEEEDLEAKAQMLRMDLGEWWEDGDEARAAGDHHDAGDEPTLLEDATAALLSLEGTMRHRYFGRDFTAQIRALQTQREIILQQMNVVKNRRKKQMENSPEKFGKREIFELSARERVEIENEPTVRAALSKLKALSLALDKSESLLRRQRAENATPLILVVSSIDVACPMIRALELSLPLLSGVVHVIVEPKSTEECHTKWASDKRKYCVPPLPKKDSIFHFNAHPPVNAEQARAAAKMVIHKDATRIARVDSTWDKVAVMQKNTTVNSEGGFVLLIEARGRVTSQDLGYVNHPFFWRPKCYLHGLDPMRTSKHPPRDAEGHEGHHDDVAAVLDAKEAGEDSEASVTQLLHSSPPLVRFHFMEDEAVRQSLLSHQQGGDRSEAAAQGIYDAVRLVRWVEERDPGLQPGNKAEVGGRETAAIVLPKANILLGQTLALEDFEELESHSILSLKVDGNEAVAGTKKRGSRRHQTLATISYSSIDYAHRSFLHPNPKYEEWHPASAE